MRIRIREIVRAISTEERRVLSEKLCNTVREQGVWQRAMGVLFYSPLADEPDVMVLLQNALTAGKRVTFPRFEPASGRYAAAEVSEHAELVSGLFGTLEPGPGCPVVPLNQLDLVLVPGIAFDLAGRRLGRGKGFYDRLLAEVRGHKCGVAFDAQIVAEVPEEPHDMRVDSILTPTRWHLCRRAD
jgi:5-formyltetrahydrofolate cyclo-ligase